MTPSARLSLSAILISLVFALGATPAQAQTVIATVTAGVAPEGVAVDTVTNKIYVANYLSDNVTVIDGTTYSTTAVPAGSDPVAVAVNEATNKIYVANRGRIDLNSGNVTVIDGDTNSTTVIPNSNGWGWIAIAVNPVTNKIYVANLLSGNVTVIDGATNSTTAVPAGTGPSAVAVNPVTNKIYVANTGSANVTVIDGATNSTTTVTDPNAISPNSVAVNSSTNKIYVANGGNYPGSNHGNVTVIDGATNATTTIAIDPNALGPLAVAVNQTSNKIYVAYANDSALTGVGGVAIIDGTTNAISNVSDPNASFPHAVAVDPMTNTIYVANQGCFPPADPCMNPGSVTVINGATNSVTTIIDPNASNPTGLALDPTTDKIYVAAGKVIVIDGGATPTTHILPLLLAGNGSGSGTVISTPAGINCSTSCTASFAAGTAVSLTASPASGSAFSGWDTNCTGTGACDVTMTSDQFVGATFGPRADFALAVAKGTPATASVTAGGTATYAISLSPLGGFNQTVTMSCMGAPPLSTCKPSPSTVTLNGTGAATVNVTVTTTARSTTPVAPWTNPTIHGEQWILACLALVLGLTLLARMVAGRFRPRSLAGLAFTATFLLIVLWAACGGASPPKFANSGTPAGTYNLTINATSGSLAHSTTVTLTVN